MSILAHENSSHYLIRIHNIFADFYYGFTGYLEISYLFVCVQWEIYWASSQSSSHIKCLLDEHKDDKSRFVNGQTDCIGCYYLFDKAAPHYINRLFVLTLIETPLALYNRLKIHSSTNKQDFYGSFRLSLWWQQWPLLWLTTANLQALAKASVS